MAGNKDNPIILLDVGFRETKLIAFEYKGTDEKKLNEKNKGKKTYLTKDFSDWIWEHRKLFYQSRCTPKMRN